MRYDIKLKTILAVIIATTITLLSIPVISDYSDNITVSQYNENVRYNMIEDSEDKLVVDWNATDGFRINGMSGIYTPVGLICNNLLYSTQASQVLIHDLANDRMVQTDTAPPTVTFENGTYSYTWQGTTYTGTYDFIFHAAKTGKYALMTGSLQSTATFNADKGDSVYVLSQVGYRTNTSYYSPVSMYEYVDGNRVRTIIEPEINPGAFTVSDVEINWGTLVDSTELYNTYGTNGSITYTVNDTEDTTSLNYIIPAKYSTTNTMTETITDIVQIIPVILIIIVLVMAATLLINNRGNDI